MVVAINALGVIGSLIVIWMFGFKVWIIIGLIQIAIGIIGFLIARVQSKK